MCSEKVSQNGNSWRKHELDHDIRITTTGRAACEICPLSRVKTGVAVRIKRLCASPETQNRLRELGLCEDQIIKLLTSQANFICQVCNARLAISSQLAQLIMVEPVRIL